ncbi:hypothetical protein AHAS_Ahas13G0276700 [Arachis hypogaea]
MMTSDLDKILANYMIPSTHETNIIADMAILIWCVSEGKQLYFPRLIRKHMGRAHYIGNLVFSCLITELATEARVVWLTTDERPTIAESKKVIPHDDWYGFQPTSRRKGRCQFIEDIARLERHFKRCYENIKRQHWDWDETIEEPDTPSQHSKEKDQVPPAEDGDDDDSFHSASFYEHQERC